MDQNQKIRKLEMKLHALVFLLIIVIVGAAFSFIPGLKNVALALSGNYSKSNGESLGIADWNGLDDDFLAKSGGTMTGNLNMGGGKVTNVAAPTVGTDVANQAYVLSKISSSGSAKDISGNSLGMFCGETLPTDWVTYGDGHTVYVDVDMSSASFSSVPYILTTLQGVSWHWKTYGVTSIYSPTSTSFRVYVYNLGKAMTASDAETWGWSVVWCGIGN